MQEDKYGIYGNPYSNNKFLETDYVRRSGLHAPTTSDSSIDRLYDLAVDNIINAYAQTGSGNDVDYNTRFAIDSIMAIATGKSYKEVADNHSLYSRMFTGEALEDKSIWQAFGDNFESYNIQRKISDKQNRLDITRDPVKINRLNREIEELEKELVKKMDFNDRGYLGNSFVSTGSIANQSLRAASSVMLATVLGAGAPLKLAIGAIGKTGFTKLGMKAMVKALTNPNALTKLGVGYNFIDTFLVERGGISREMSQMVDNEQNGQHINDTTRNIASTIYGVISTGIEYVTLDPIFGKFLKGKGGSRIMKDSFLGFLGSAGKNILKAGTSESIEEFLQSGLSVITTDLAKAYSDSNGTDFNPRFAETMKNAFSEGASAFIQTFGPSAMLGIPGNTVNLALNSFALKHPSNIDTETMERMRKEAKGSPATASTKDVAQMRLSISSFQNIDEDATIMDFDQIIIPDEVPKNDYSDYGKTETTDAQKLPTIEVVEDENRPGMYRALSDEDNDMINWMFDKEALGVAVRVLSTKQDSTKNIDIPTLTNIADLMGFKIENGEAVFDNQSDIDALRNADNIDFVSKDGTFINAIDKDGNDIQIPIKVRNTSLINSIVEATGGKISEQRAEALSIVLSSIKTPEGTKIGIKKVEDLDEKTKALLKEKRGAVLVDKLAIVLSPKSDETTVEHEGFHIVDILDDEHRGQLVKAISDVIHDENAYAELIDILNEHKNQLGGKTVEEFIELLKKMDSTNENDNDMREARASLYEIWRETMSEEDYKKLPKNLSEAFKLIAESFKRIYNNLTGHKLDSRISDAFSQMYGSQNTSNKSLKEKNSILFQAKKNGEYEEIRNKYINTDQWMKAPNGKPTNLTEEQWIEVRTPSFKRWFGDWENDAENASKILDENGEPLVVYHGTEKEFTIFDKNRIGSNVGAYHGFGFNFAPYPSTQYGRNEMDVYLNIRNPLSHTAHDIKLKDAIEIIKAVDIERHEDMWNSLLWNYTNPEFSPKASQREMEAFYDKAVRKVAKQFLDYAGNDADFYVQLSSSGSGDANEFIKVFESLGYDGVMHDDGVVIAFEPNQIKSATDNIGTFDSDNPSILFQSDIDEEDFFDNYDDPYWDSINEEIDEAEESIEVRADKTTDFFGDIEVPENNIEEYRPIPEAIQKKSENKANGKKDKPAASKSTKSRKKTTPVEKLSDVDVRNITRRFERKTMYSSFTAKEIEQFVELGVYVPSEVLVDVYNTEKDRLYISEPIKEEIEFRARIIQELGDLKNGEAISIIKQAETEEQAVKFMMKYYGNEAWNQRREDDVRKLYRYVHTPTLSQMRKSFINEFASRKGIDTLRSFYSIHPVVTRNSDGTISQRLVTPVKSHSYNKLNERHAGGWTDANYKDVIDDIKHNTSQWIRDYLHQKASFETIQYNRDKDNPQMMKTMAEIAFLSFSHADDSFLQTVESMQVGKNIAESDELKKLYLEIDKNNVEIESSIDSLIQNIDNVEKLDDAEKERIREEVRDNLEAVIEKYSKALAEQKGYYNEKIADLRKAKEYQNKRRLVQNKIKRILNVDLSKYDYSAVPAMSFVYNLMHNKFAQYQLGTMTDEDYLDYRTFRGEAEQNWIVFNNVVSTVDEFGNAVEFIKDVEFNEGADFKSIEAMPESLRSRLPQELIDKIETQKDDFRWLSLDNSEMLQIFDALSDIKQEARNIKVYKDAKIKLDRQNMAINATSSIRKTPNFELTDEIRKEYYDAMGIDAEDSTATDSDIIIWYQQNIRRFDSDSKEFGKIGEGASFVAGYVGKISRLCRFLDGNKEGAMYDTFVNKPQNALREEKLHSQERKSRYSTKLQEILDDESLDGMDAKKKNKFLRGKVEIKENGGGKMKDAKGWDLVGINLYARNFRGFLKLINPKGNNISLYEMARINPEATKRFLEYDMQKREEFKKKQLDDKLNKLQERRSKEEDIFNERNEALDQKLVKAIDRNNKALNKELNKKRKNALTQEEIENFKKEYSDKEQQIIERHLKKKSEITSVDHNEYDYEIERIKELATKRINNFVGVLKIGKVDSTMYNEEVDVLNKLNNGYDFGSVPSFVSRIADLLIETASERQDAMQKYSYDNENLIFTLAEEYFPFISKTGSVDAVIGGIHSKKNVNNGNIKARLNTVYELDTNVGMNIFGVIDKQEHLMAFGQLIKDLNWIGSPTGGNLYSIVEMKYGKNMKSMLKDYVEDLATFKTDPSGINKVVNNIINNASVAVLANPMVSIKQMLSAIPALTSDQISTKDWIKAFMLNAKSEIVTDTYEQYAPEIANGSMSIAINELHERMQKSQISEFQKNMYGKLMFLTEYIDDLLKKTIWYAKFNKELELKQANGIRITSADIEESANKASTLVKETQSTTDIISMSKLQKESRKDVFKKTFFLFTNDIFNIWNIVYGDIPNAWKSGKKKTAIKMAMGVTTSALILALLKGGWIPDKDEEEKFDEEEFLKNFLLTGLGYSTPMIGNIFENLDNTYSVSSNFFQQTISEPVSDAFKLFMMPTKDEDYGALDYLDQTLDTMLHAGKVVGIPTVLIDRLLKIPFPEGLAGGFEPSWSNIGYLFGTNWGKL